MLLFIFQKMYKGSVLSICSFTPLVHILNELSFHHDVLGSFSKFISLVLGSSWVCYHLRNIRLLSTYKSIVKTLSMWGWKLNIFALSSWSKISIGPSILNIFIILICARRQTFILGIVAQLIAGHIIDLRVYWEPLAVIFVGFSIGMKFVRKKFKYPFY